MAQIDKSSEMRAQEAQIKALEEAIKKKRTTVKSLRTRLTNLETEIRRVNEKLSNLAYSVVERTFRLQEEMKSLMDQLLKKRWLKRRKDLAEEVKLSRAQMDASSHIDELDDMLEEMRQDPKGWQEKRAQQQAGEEGTQDRAAFFAQFKQEPSKEEQRDIRQLYLRLSRKLHPDKATNEAEAQQFHNLMQQVSAAYEAHDVEALLALEERYLDDDREAWEELPGEQQLSARAQKIARLERELSFLTQQGDRLSAQIKALRQSEAGQQLTHVQREERYGRGLDHSQVEAEMAFEAMEKQKEVLEAALKADRVTPELEALFQPLDDDMDEMELLQMMGELVGMGLDDEDEDEEEPRFEEGDLVEFRPKRGKQYYLAPPKGAVAFITEVDFDDWKGEFSYGLLFSPETLSALKRGPEFWLEEYYDHALVYVFESDLKPVSGRKAPGFDEEAALAHGRELIYDYLFNQKLKLPKSQQLRLRDFLFRNPAAPDYLNLHKWFEASKLAPKLRNLPIRLKANPFFKAGQKGKLVRSLGINKEVGFIVEIRVKQYTNEIPLFFLAYEGKNPAIQEFFEDYALWAKHRVPQGD
jgi:hypothetical protein